MGIAWPLAALVAGSAVFCGLTVVAALLYLKDRRRASGGPAPGVGVSILKPLSGVDDGLERNLRTFFEQNFAEFEVLFAVTRQEDPAARVAAQLQAEYPDVPSRLLVVGEPAWPNRKVWSLAALTAAARFPLLAMCDSDTAVTPDFLRSLSAEFADPRLDVTTCPYRAVPGKSLWSALEAIMMNTEFLSGILVARLLEGMKFAVGPTIVVRREAIGRIGGWERLKDYLAEDFELGRLAAEAGCGVGLSGYVIEHHIGASRFRSNAEHRLRWCRSTRRSRPAGYLGQIFTNPTPLALLLWIAAPAWWPLAVAALAARAAAALATAGWVLHDPLCARLFFLIPAADLASFLFWVAGFFGGTIAWRGHRYLLRRDGTFERIE